MAHKGQIVVFEFYRSFTWPNLAGTIFWASLVLKFEYDNGKIIYNLCFKLKSALF